MVWPIASAAEYPKTRVAPAFQLRMTLSSVLPTTASSDDSTIAASHASGFVAKRFSPGSPDGLPAEPWLIGGSRTLVNKFVTRASCLQSRAAMSRTPEIEAVFVDSARGGAPTGQGEV